MRIRAGHSREEVREIVGGGFVVGVGARGRHAEDFLHHVLSKGCLVAAGTATSVHLWDVSISKAVAALGAGQGSSRDVAFRPDGTRLT
jgi:hypothetical protein